MASIRAAAAGMPAAIHHNMLMAVDLPELVRVIVDNIDDFERLDDMQRQAFALAQAEYRWQVRGQEMKAAIEAAVSVSAESRAAR